MVVMGSAPADWASRDSSSMLASKSPAPKSMPTKAARMVSFGIVSGTSTAAAGLFSVGLKVEVDGAGRHDGGNGMLVDHLGDGVTQQHHVLVERFDVPLQLDAVDQIDRTGTCSLRKAFKNGSC